MIGDDASRTDTEGDVAVAEEVLGLLAARGATLAVAESLTGGMLTSTLVDVPGASAVLRGGLVPYATDLKHVLLGVDQDLLIRVGVVHPDVARAMALGARERLGATWAVATTGVAGPDPQDGHPVGTVDIAVAGPGDVVCRRLALPGARYEIRAAAVAAALRLLRDRIAATEPSRQTDERDTASPWRA